MWYYRQKTNQVPGIHGVLHSTVRKLIALLKIEAPHKANLQNVHALLRAPKGCTAHPVPWKVVCGASVR